MKKILSLIALFAFLQACSQKKEGFYFNKEKNTDKMLKSQLEKGVLKYISDTESPVDNYSIEDMKSNVEIAENLLKVRGFKKPTKEEFNTQVKNIFGRIIDNNSPQKYLYINSHDKCERRNLNTYQYWIDFHTGTYIIKDGCFITDFYRIPELIDYQKEYPSLFQYEKTLPVKQQSKEYGEIEISLWKDLPDLSQQRQKNIEILVNRNKYLFNDSMASLVWLKFHDDFFLNGLVKVFGYVEDKDLLKWVLDRSLNNDESKEKEFEKMLFTKTCDNKYVFHKEVLELMAHVDAKSKKRYLDFLMVYSPKLDGLNFSDATRIKALYCYYATKIDRDYMFEFFPLLNDEESEEEIKKNNYYNLPDFKELYKETRYHGMGPAE